MARRVGRVETRMDEKLARIPRRSSSLKVSRERVNFQPPLPCFDFVLDREREREKKVFFGRKVGERCALKFTHVASRDSRYVIRTDFDRLEHSSRGSSASRIFPARYPDAFPCSEIPSIPSRSNGFFRSAFAETQSKNVASVSRLTGRISILQRRVTRSRCFEINTFFLFPKEERERSLRDVLLYSFHRSSAHVFFQALRARINERARTRRASNLAGVETCGRL